MVMTAKKKKKSVHQGEENMLFQQVQNSFSRRWLIVPELKCTKGSQLDPV